MTDDLPPGRWCARCNLHRLSDCSILCFATRIDGDLSRTDHTLYTLGDQ